MEDVRLDLKRKTWEPGLSNLLSCVLGLQTAAVAKSWRTTRQPVGKGWEVLPTWHYVVQWEGQIFWVWMRLASGPGQKSHKARAQPACRGLASSVVLLIDKLLPHQGLMQYWVASGHLPEWQRAFTARTKQLPSMFLKSIIYWGTHTQSCARYEYGQL